MDPLSIVAVITLVGKSASAWLGPISEAFLSKSAELALEKSANAGQSWLYLDEKRQLYHLELALKNAAERGLAHFHTFEERDRYRDMLQVLCDSGLHGQKLRKEASRLFILFETPNVEALNETYNLSRRIQGLTQEKRHEDVDMKPYLDTFFKALVAELYIDPLFREQISDTLKVHAMLAIQRSLEEVGRHFPNSMRHFLLITVLSNLSTMSRSISPMLSERLDISN